MSIMNRGYSYFSLIFSSVAILLLGIVAIIIISPQELQRERRDKERTSIIKSIGQASHIYSQSKNGALPYETVNWLPDIVARGELPSLPSAIEYDDSAAICKNNAKNGFCYDTDGKIPPTGAIVYTKLESLKENKKCRVSVGESAWIVFDSQSGRNGVVCKIGSEPSFVFEGQQFID